MNPKRKKAEELLYRVFDKFDPSRTNSNFYKKKFGKMNDAQFMNYMKNQFPIKFQYTLFEIKPTPDQIVAGLKEMGVPLFESVALPYLSEDEDGNPIETQECEVGYLPIKKMKQFLTKKVGMSTDISSRDARTGLLLNHDKNGNTTDREFEALAVQSMDKTAEEFAGPRADAMDQKNTMYNAITTMGKVRLEDLPKDQADSLSRNMINTYLLGSLLKSNLIEDDYHLRKTIEGSRGISRET